MEDVLGLKSALSLSFRVLNFLWFPQSRTASVVRNRPGWLGKLKAMVPNVVCRKK